MKKFLVPALIPFLVQCGSQKSSSEDQPLTETAASTGAAEAGVSTPTAPNPTPVPAPIEVPEGEKLDRTQSSALTIQFQTKVGAEDLLCSDKTEASIQRGQIFTDLRFFVSNLTLVDDQGKLTPVQLDVTPNSSNFQYIDDAKNSIALLNFLDSSCASSDATKTVKTALTGLLQQGVYKELRFQLGLPYAPMDEALTQVPSALAPSDMGWMWQHFPADIQFELHTGKSKKMLNALTSANKRVISIPLQHTQNSSAQTLAILMDLSKMFPVDAKTFVNSLESACNNSNKIMTESSPNCAFAFKSLGLEVANAKQPYAQTIFSMTK